MRKLIDHKSQVWEGGKEDLRIGKCGGEAFKLCVGCECVAE